MQEFRQKIKDKLIVSAVPRMKIEYSEENFRKLFGEWGRVDTPVGRVVIPKKQFIKLRELGREGWLGAMYQAITEPVFVIQETPVKKAFLKTFVPENKGTILFISVFLELEGNKINITNHQKDIDNILKKIKKTSDVVYEKATITGNSNGHTASRLGILPSGGNGALAHGRNDYHLSLVSTPSGKESRIPGGNLPGFR